MVIFIFKLFFLSFCVLMFSLVISFISFKIYVEDKNSLSDVNIIKLVSVFINISKLFLYAIFFNSVSKFILGFSLA